MEAVELTDEVIAGLNDEQITLLQELGELAAKKLKVTSEIEEFTGEVMGSQRTMGFQTKDNPSALHEDPEIVALVTIKERYKLSNVREQIRRTLRRAVNLNLGHLAIIRRQCKNYEVDCT